MAQRRKNGQLFINPYNFVPVDLQKTQRFDITQPQEESLTGYFDCVVKCRTPLAIPDTARGKEKEEGHFAYPLFTIDGQTPMIPGSAIRGVIRSVYETLTNSCFGTMQKNTRITARNVEAFSPGLLIHRNGTWELHAAERRLLVTDRSFHEKNRLKEKGVSLYDEKSLKGKTGDEVNFLLIREGGQEAGYSKRGFRIGTYINLTDQGPGSRTGYLCIGEKAPRRHFQSVFEKKTPLRKVSQEDFEGLEAVLEVYRDEKINKLYKNGHNGYREYEYEKQKGVIPVYYLINKNKVCLSPASLGRKAFKETLNKKAGEKSHQNCDSRTNLCPACALFGTTEGEKAGSKLRFTDAECIDFHKDQIIKEVTFQELGSPRMSYLPFYLREKKPKTDYSEGYDSPALEIRGRKFYWHHKPDMSRDVLRSKRNATFDVVDQGTKFRFRVYFYGISGRQMELLAASLHLNENIEDGRYCHKIGHGKPLGYGSVKIFVETCRIREFSGKGWKEKEEPVPCSEECCQCDERTYQSLMKISDFYGAENHAGAEVMYPEVTLDPALETFRSSLKENTLASHQWFSENYKLGKLKPIDTLPEILADSTSLEKYEVFDLDEKKDLTRQNKQKNSGEKQDGHYLARIKSKGRPGRNEKFLEYDVEIENAAEFKGKPCTMTAHKSIRLSVGEKVPVKLFRGTIFNLRR